MLDNDVVLILRLLHASLHAQVVYTRRVMLSGSCICLIAALTPAPVIGSGCPPPVHRTAMRRACHQYEELARYAARVQGLLLSAWETSTCLREIMVETVIARQVEIRLYAKVSALTISEFVTGDGREQRSVTASWCLYTTSTRRVVATRTSCARRA